jgi:lysophospholipase L1-like esterase
MTILNSGEKTTITVPAGKVPVIVGTHGTSGSVHLLNEALGGNASSRNWGVGEGVLEQIGPFATSQQYLVVCSLGSIDATVGDAALGAPVAPSRYRLPQLPNRHIRKVQSSFAPQANASDWTHNLSVMADGAYEWMRLIVANSDTVNPLIGVKGLIAATDSAADLIHPQVAGAQNNTIQAIGSGVGWNAVTWDGGATSTTVPVAAAGVGGTPYQVSYKFSDWVRRRSLSVPAALGRILVPASCNTMTLCTNTVSGWTPPGGKHFKGSRQNVDAVSSNPNLYTTTGEGSGYGIAGIEFRGTMPALSVMFMGDSTYQGYGLPYPQNNWCQQAIDNLQALGYPVSMIQGSWTGTVSADYYSRAKEMLVQFKPSIMFYEIGSSNDLGAPLDQVMIDRMYAQAMDLADLAASLGTILVMTTWIPNNYTNGTTDPFRNQLNSRAKASAWLTCDLDGAVSDGAIPAKIKSEFSQGDATPHKNAAGHAVVAARAQSTIQQIISGNAGAFA